MKKSYLMLVASAAIFAACSETEKIQENLQDNEPAAIGFTSYAEKATRGNTNIATNLEFYHNTFAVYGTKQNKNDNTDIQYVFGGKATGAGAQDGVTCTYQTSEDNVLKDWKYENPRFWDKQADYDFIAYSPVSAKNPIRYYYKDEDAQVGDNGNWFKTTAAYTLTGTNLQATATQAEKIKGFNGTDDLDLMISGSNAQDGNNHSDYVNLQFRHILSKLNVKIGQAEALHNSDVTIKEVKLTGFKDQGTYDQSDYDNTADPKVSGWSAGTSVNNANYALQYTGNQLLGKGTYEDDDQNIATPEVFVPADPFFFIENLVMPQTIADNQVELTIKYNIKSGTYSEDYTYKLDLYDLAALHKFYDGYNYYLNITIEPDVIKFDASVTEWDNQTVVNKTVQ